MGVHDYGCHLFPAAIGVLREYGDLVVGDSNFRYHLSPEGCFLRGDKESWLYWEWEVKEILFPFAYKLDGEPETIALSYSGKVYETGNGFYLLGNSIEDFLNTVLLHPEERFSRWITVVPTHMNPEIDVEFERIYNAVYGNESS